MIDSEVTDADDGGDAIRPIVEVVLDEPSTAQAGRPVVQGSSAAAMIAAMARHGIKTDPIAAPEVAPDAAAAAAAPEATAVPDPAAAAVDSDAPPAEEVAPEDKPAEKPPESERAAEPAPDPVALAAVRAELDTARAEAALLRARLSGDADDGPNDARQRWVADPVATLRQSIAGLIGKPADSKEVTEEMAFLQRELTTDAIGADNLSQDTRLQRSQEHTDRRWRFDQHAQAASRETADQKARRADTLKAVTSAIEATAKDHPFIALATELDGLDPAKAVDLLWADALQTGRAKPGATFEDSLREALRLANGYYQSRAERISRLRPQDTAPAPAPAPAPASAPAAAPGAPKQPTSPAPAKTGSASPGTLSAKQAAAAPSAKAPAPQPTGPIVVDPTDREGDQRRIRDIVAKHRRP